MSGGGGVSVEVVVVKLDEVVVVLEIGESGPEALMVEVEGMDWEEAEPE